VPIVLGGTSDAALARVAAWGDGWYGFNLDGVPEAAERLRFLKGRCAELGRDAAELRCAVSLREARGEDVDALSKLGVDELVVVAEPPADPQSADEWVKGLAGRWMPALA
jgi:alkanesulfonate monooxygenase SsuD/methylene tetrahydromethanopterin reductase-like flavin-dependent oxidoreductase (luciferase family)